MNGQLKIGWIGLGKMGLPMARNLLRAGWPATVYNRTASVAETLTGEGATKSASPREVAQNSEVVFSMIADDAALEDVALGPNGALGSMHRGSIFVEMSTVSPLVSARVAEAARSLSVGYLRAPVSGSVAMAAQGKLTIFVSGESSDFERCRPAFEKLGAKLFHVGKGEEARTLKLALNLMVGATAAMLGESLTLCEKAGLDWNTTLDVIGGSVVASPLVGYKVEPLRKRDFTPMFSASQMAKDFGLILDAASAEGLHLPIAADVMQYWKTMIASGLGDQDFAGCVAVVDGAAAKRSA